MLTTDWLMDRLPAEAMAMMRLLGSLKMCSLRKVAMLSTPALVRVSANMTSPSRTRIPQQYVIALPAPAAIFIAAAVGLRQWLACRRGALLVDFDGDRQGLFAGAVAGAADRRGAESVKPDGDAHIGVGWADAVCNVEADPAEAGHMRLGPGVTAAFLLGAGAAQIAGDIARRDAQAARRAEEQMRHVAGNAAFARERFGGRHRRRPRRGVFADRLIVQSIQQSVQVLQRIAAIGRANVESKILDSRISLRQGRIAQEQARRETLERTAHDAVGILRLDLAVDLDAQLREWTVSGKDMGQVAESVLVSIEPRVAGDVDAPADHILAFMVARRQPQHLNYTGGRWIVRMDDPVGAEKAHIRKRESAFGYQKHNRMGQTEDRRWTTVLSSRFRHPIDDSGFLILGALHQILLRYRGAELIIVLDEVVDEFMQPGLEYLLDAAVLQPGADGPRLPLRMALAPIGIRDAVEILHEIFVAARQRSRH